MFMCRHFDVGSGPTGRILTFSNLRYFDRDDSSGLGQAHDVTAPLLVQQRAHRPVTPPGSRVIHVYVPQTRRYTRTQTANLTLRTFLCFPLQGCVPKCMSICASTISGFPCYITYEGTNPGITGRCTMDCSCCPKDTLFDGTACVSLNKRTECSMANNRVWNGTACVDVVEWYAKEHCTGSG